MPTEFELRQRNAQFANRARAGKNPVKPSRQERLAKRSPISLWALGAILFVVVGGAYINNMYMVDIRRVKRSK
ncbi:hypothetical protein PHLCEN_2v2833 [Hermanssonia centrifuga]|uniref:Stress-associated endoplasmic reticulum protein n=1 Tax=Hermanssonia centrifuga TaxID=98765 RepID=A0A2R6RI41_9APHY|nr:hypothetical protein PHLCEN_2v2833 [Hermanssonia centrifuga]